ncbi:tetratricopeptide (TPR) repeat protein [Elusimicrobium posterum]|uniref:tetratricopeptide repeat protein n=1 Tax=Elusimicrobium posterum TaxID=3116653 RepID=UPI003C70BC00
MNIKIILIVLVLFSAAVWGGTKFFHRDAYSETVAKAYEEWRGNNGASAAELFMQAVNLKPASEEAYEGLFYLALLEEDFETAYQTATLMAQNTKSAAAPLYRARALLNIDAEDGQVLEILNNVKIQFPEPYLYLEAASLYCGVREYQKALDIVAAYFEAGGQPSFTTYYMKADFYRLLQDYDRMEENLMEAEELYGEEIPLVKFYTNMKRNIRMVGSFMGIFRRIEQRVGKSVKYSRAANEALFLAMKKDPELKISENFPVCGTYNALHESFNYNPVASKLKKEIYYPKKRAFELAARDTKIFKVSVVIINEGSDIEKVAEVFSKYSKLSQDESLERLKKLPAEVAAQVPGVQINEMTEDFGKVGAILEFGDTGQYYTDSFSQTPVVQIIEKAGT